MKKFLLICGLSGSGKSYIERQLVKDPCYKSLNFNRLIQVTTRSKRPNEVDGLDYYFIDKNEYHSLEKDLLAKTFYYDNYYGTIDDSIEYKYNKKMNINTIVVNREGHDKAVEDIKNKYSEYSIITILIKNDNPEERSNRSINKEIDTERLDEIAEIVFDNEEGNRLSSCTIINELYRVGFIDDEQLIH